MADIEASKKANQFTQKLVQNWNHIFHKLGRAPDEDKPIKDEEFKNPYSYTVKNTLYLYSLDMYLYGCLNWAARSKTYLKNMGCFASVLSQVLMHASRYRE